MKIKFVGIVFFSVALLSTLNAAAEDIAYDEYDVLLQDLRSFYKFGYKKDYREMTKADDLTQGQLVNTTNALDTAIIGEGFFRVYDEINDSYLYTRSGQFTLNLDRKVSTLDGYIVSPEIRIDSFNFDVSQKIKLFLPVKGSKIESDDGVYFLFEEVNEVESPIVVPNKLESSSVDLQYSVVRMMEILERIALEPPRNQPEGLQTKRFLLQELFKSSIEYPLRFDTTDGSGYFSADGTFISGGSGERIVIRGVTVEVEKQTPYVSLRQASTYQALNNVVQKTLDFLEI